MGLFCKFSQQESGFCYLCLLFEEMVTYSLPLKTSRE